jgi:hypothetical protein
MSNFRSNSIPYRDIGSHELENARARHLRRLSEISTFPSNRIDNISPVNYSDCRRPGKKFRLNGKRHSETNREIQESNLKLFLKLYHITKQNALTKLKISNSSFRKEKKRKISKIDNSLILQRLTSVKSSLKLHDFEKDFQNHREYVQLGQRLRLPKLKS